MKLLGIYDDLSSAQTALADLQAAGIDPRFLTLAGGGEPKSGAWKKSLAWGGAAGVAASLLLPGGGHVLLAGHLARAAALHVVGVTAKAAATGAAAGSAVGWLRNAGLHRLALKEVRAALAAKRFALLIKSDWLTQQRAAQVLAQPPEPRLLALVERYGWEHQSFLSLYDGMKVWWTQEPEAAVVYRRIGSVVIVTATPLAAREDWRAVTLRFLDWCKTQNLDCLMLPVGADFADVARECGMALLRIGESGYFKLPEWKPAGDRAKKVRAGVNQARKAGMRVERFDPAQGTAHGDAAVRAEIEALCQRWVNTREVDAFGWLLELDPFKLSEHKRYFLARDAAGRLTGLLVCSPIYARHGWYLEDLIRHPQAERGVSELLVVEALQQLAAEGAQVATLATSPLAGIDPAEYTGQLKQLARLLKLIYEHLDAFYHFKALHRFKAKFAPSFVEPEYVAIYPPRVRLRMITSFMGALDPAGFTGVFASKLQRLWREMQSHSTTSAESTRFDNPGVTPRLPVQADGE